MTTVKVDGSLKQLLKYSQAFTGSTFRSSFIRIGCTLETKLEMWLGVHQDIISHLAHRRYYPKEIRISIVEFLHPVGEDSIRVSLSSTDCFFCHLHHYSNLFFLWHHVCSKKLIYKLEISIDKFK